MPNEPRRLTAWLLFAGVAAAVLAVGGYIVYLRPAAERARVRSLLDRYEATPSQGTAQALAELLDQQRVPAEVGGRILEALLTPDVAVRDGYPAGPRVTVAAHHPYALRFRRSRISRQRDVCADGRKLYGGGGGGNVVETQPDILVMNPGSGPTPEPGRPGTYQRSIRYQWGLIPCGDDGRPIGSEPAYACAFEVPVTFRIVAAERAEQIRRRSGPELDRAMRAAVRFSPSDVHFTGKWQEGRQRRVTGRVLLESDPLPESVGFRFRFRDQGGLTLPLPGHSVRARKGQRVAPHFPAEELPLPPGRYVGTAILEADELAAYPDAGIKVIWGGTLELPVEFVVRVVESREGRPGGSGDAQ